MIEPRAQLPVSFADTMTEEEMNSKSGEHERRGCPCESFETVRDVANIVMSNGNDTSKSSLDMDTLLGWISQKKKQRDKVKKDRSVYQEKERENSSQEIGPWQNAGVKTKKPFVCLDKFRGKK